MSAVILCLTEGGRATAGRLRTVLPDAVLLGRAGRVRAADDCFDDAIAEIRRHFRAGEAIIGVCAAGILIRALAPLLEDKTREPPVLAIAEDGSAVIPLLGGHNGANALARRIADALGIRPAITTASELGLGHALDDPPPRWRVANRSATKGVVARLLAGETVQLVVEDGLEARWLDGLDGLRPDGAPPGVTVTRRAVSSEDLTLHPTCLAVGVGCARDADPANVVAFVRNALAEAGLAREAVALVASIDLKMDEPAVHAVAGEFDVPARFFTPETLETETPRLQNPSMRVFAEVGSHGVAEAAALAATGSEGRLIVPKRKSDIATVAIAASPRPLDPSIIGRARGRLAVLGIGPGDARLRTPEVDRHLEMADEVVGYRLYIELLGPRARAKALEAPGLGGERERVALALSRAAKGKRVALVSSGDAGVYGLASLALELIDRAEDPEWRQVELMLAPGVSAMQMAAARLGAPLGHDFCAISLSDLLTPWDVIERRIEAAGAGDFVIAFYNPRSERRADQLLRARDILLRHRPAETPAAIARNLARDGEQVTVTTLGEFEPNTVDMLSLVLVGASSSRRARFGGRDWIYTPRGYLG